ncbi:divergent PAP2 family protein [Niallia sp.]|uniref:divergent PAP2 family protein n=1 Tax=Niallia sp. TaxID=2837523 RepID=UPI00289948E2|nr:divergent PAP2 family protein [Niallia sp.]
MNKGIYVALISIGMAQFLKIPIHFFKTKKWVKGLFFQTGGMPSSHSAGVSSLTTFIALKRGLPTIDFALSLIFGLIVMYDAQGIRRQTGELTLKVNDLGELVDKINKDKNIAYKEQQPKKLKEMLGHQPQEVFGGALLGVFIGFLGHICTKKKRTFIHR